MLKREWQAVDDVFPYSLQYCLYTTTCLPSPSSTPLSPCHSFFLFFLLWFTRQKERDLELAARIGQSLLEENKSLKTRNDQLELEITACNESVSFLHRFLYCWSCYCVETREEKRCFLLWCSLVQNCYYLLVLSNSSEQLIHMPLAVSTKFYSWLDRHLPFSHGFFDVQSLLESLPLDFLLTFESLMNVLYHDSRFQVMLCFLSFCSFSFCPASSFSYMLVMFLCWIHFKQAYRTLKQNPLFLNEFLFWKMVMLLSWLWMDMNHDLIDNLMIVFSMWCALSLLESNLLLGFLKLFMPPLHFNYLFLVHGTWIVSAENANFFLVKRVLKQITKLWTGYTTQAWVKFQDWSPSDLFTRPRIEWPWGRGKRSWRRKTTCQTKLYCCRGL